MPKLMRSDLEIIAKQTRYGTRTKTQNSTIKFPAKKSGSSVLTGKKLRSSKQDINIVTLPTQLKSPKKRLQSEEIKIESSKELKSPRKRLQDDEEISQSDLDASPSKRSRSRSTKRENVVDSTPTKSRTLKKKLFTNESDEGTLESETDVSPNKRDRRLKSKTDTNSIPTRQNTPKKKLFDNENEEERTINFPKQKSASTVPSIRKSLRIGGKQKEIDSKPKKETPKIQEEPLAIELEDEEVTSTTFSTLGEEVDCALAALNRNIPEKLPGRDHLSEQLQDIIVDAFENKESKSIYVSGSPGSGKTVTMKILLTRPNIKRKCVIIYINCMKLGIKETIYYKITNDGKTKTDIVKNATIGSVEERIMRHRKPVLLVLDEIDEINTKDPKDLYAIFGLTSSLPKGKIVLIGIGNTLNFINKHLPFLRFKDCKPITIQFPSYTDRGIVDIITYRLKNVPFQRLKFPESAIELLARKVASFGGDARAAIGVACASIREILKQADLNSSEGEYTVDLITVKTVVDAMYDTVERFRKEKKTINSSCQIDTFPLQQKLILCALLLVIKKNICPVGELTLNKIREMYKEMCESEKCEALIHSEFLNACKLIESYQIFSIINKAGKKKKQTVNKVMLKWDVDEMTKVLSKERLFGNILSSHM